jgi:hypothetical protein
MGTATTTDPYLATPEPRPLTDTQATLRGRALQASAWAAWRKRDRERRRAFARSTYPVRISPDANPE